MVGPATLIDHGKNGWLRITGSERKTWLQGITTADVMNNASHAFWGLFLDRTGKIRHEVIGIEDDDSLRLSSLGQGLDSLYQYLDAMLVMEDVALQKEPDCSLWSLHGHPSQAAVPARASEAADADVISSPELRQRVPHGRLAWVSPADWVFAVRGADEPEWRACMGERGLVAATGEWERMRIAAGVPAWGVDYTEKDTPHHAGLYGRAVAPNKGCYLGQEVVCKVEMRGHVAQRVARILLDSPEGLTPGLPITLKDSGETIGTLTSVVAGRERGAYALARVKTSALDTNRDLNVGGACGRFVDSSPAGP